MSVLSEITPVRRLRLIDLAQEAGVNVTGWNSPSNPKYCYEWAFIEPKAVVVLNLWLGLMEVSNGQIIRRLNLREEIAKYRAARRAVCANRAERMEKAIEMARESRLPIRVIVLDGKMRNPEDMSAKPSKVDKRLLDPLPWSIAAYNDGCYTLIRGSSPFPFADQFDISDVDESTVDRRMVLGQPPVRDPKVRQQVLIRAAGKCELCHEPGFVMVDGRRYLETHHIIALSEGGSDSEVNVVALCPNHHREAHYGEKRESIKDKLHGLVEGYREISPLER